MISFAMPDVDLRDNFLDYAATAGDSRLIGFTKTNAVVDWPNISNGLPSTHFLVFEASGNTDLGSVEFPFVTITCMASTGTPSDARPLARALRDALPHLVGRSVVGIDSIRGPSKGTDVSARKIWVITCSLTTLGVASF